MQRNAQLDGLRALAAIAVVLFHAKVPGFAGGHLGVDLFFVLSGYLITSLLIAKPQNLRTFYARRALRLYPALLAMLALHIALLPFYPAMPAHPVNDVLVAMAYLSDYMFTLFHRPQYIAHTWTLSVEEHYYLLWPLLLPFVRRRPVMILALAFACLTAWRLYSSAVFGWDVTAYRFDTRATGLVLGSAAAFVAISPRMAGVLFLGGTLAAIATFRAEGLGLMLTGAEFASLGLVMLAVHGKLPIVASLQWLGVRSYGIYLFHHPLRDVLYPHMDWPGLAAVILLASIALAALSYATIEQWALRWRDAQLGSVPKHAGSHLPVHNGSLRIE